MEKQMLVQKLVNSSSSYLEVAEKYYIILAALNNIPLTKTGAKLLAFIAINGSISSGGAKELFTALYGCPKASIGNMVCKLKKQGMLVTINKKVVLSPFLYLDFNSFTVILQIILENGGETN